MECNTSHHVTISDCVRSGKVQFATAVPGGTEPLTNVRFPDKCTNHDSQSPDWLTLHHHGITRTLLLSFFSMPASAQQISHPKAVTANEKTSYHWADRNSLDLLRASNESRSIPRLLNLVEIIMKDQGCVYYFRVSMSHLNIEFKNLGFTIDSEEEEHRHWEGGIANFSRFIVPAGHWTFGSSRISIFKLDIGKLGAARF